MSDRPPEPVQPRHSRRRWFLVTLAVAALFVGLPMAALAAWWGIGLATALAEHEDPRVAFCPLPDVDGGTLRTEDMQLRRQIAEMEATLARRRGNCAICDEPEVLNVAVVVDTSQSMRWPASMDAAAEAERMAKIEREAGPIDQPAAQDRLQAEWGQTPAGQDRMEAARTAALAGLAGFPARARVRLFSFMPFDEQHVEASQCGIADRGSFVNNERAGLRTALQGLKPDAGATPLAKAIETGAAAVKERPSGTPGIVVVVTDGVDTCGGDPCAAARAARAADPGLSISVVDIAANRQLACLAEATGGRVFAPAAGAGLGQAVTDALRPDQRMCIPRPS